jgi:hypothetical protein
VGEWARLTPFPTASPLDRSSDPSRSFHLVLHNVRDGNDVNREPVLVVSRRHRMRPSVLLGGVVDS